MRARCIPVDYAAHSAHVEEIREELLKGCAGIVPRSGGVPFYSAVTGGLLDTAVWAGSIGIGICVRWCSSIGRCGAVLGGGGVGAFVEVSPHPVLTVGVQEMVEAEAAG